MLEGVPWEDGTVSEVSVETTSVSGCSGPITAYLSFAFVCFIGRIREDVNRVPLQGL